MRIGIQHKLAIAFVIVVVIVASALFLGVQRSFSQGFLHYINELREQELTVVAESLQQNFNSEADWAHLSQNPRVWHRVIRNATGGRETLRLDAEPRDGKRDRRKHEDRRDRRHRDDEPRRGKRDDGDQRHRRPPPEWRDNGRPRPPNSEFNRTDKQGRPLLKEDDFRPRPPRKPPERRGDRPKMPFVLLSADKSMLYGPRRGESEQRQSEWLAELLLKPVYTEDGELLGYLGIPKIKKASNDADKVFLQEQTQVFAWLTVGAILLSLLMAWPIARRLSAPIKKVGQGMNALTQREYDTRVDIKSKDELGDLAKNFNQMARTLGEYDESQREWLADIAHELRTPLAVLRGEIEAMQDGIRPLNQDSITSLGNETKHLSHLVDDLHQLALSDMGTLRYRFSPLFLHELLEQQLAMADYGLQQANITPDIKVVGKPYELDGDEHRLHQLFNNFLQNTLRYTDAPGQLQITINYGKQLTFIWEDSSPGVKPENLNKLFDRLYREDQSRNRSLGGSGLGLAICKNIVEAHQGIIHAELSSLGGLKIIATFSLE